MAEHDTAASGPRISIITPVRNAAATLGRCLASVAADKGLVIEHIVVDGQSTDGSRDILRAREGDFLRVIDAPPRGIADAFNRGVAAARGDWVGIINGDDWYEPGAMAAVAAAMLDGPMILHGRTRLHNPTTGTARESGPLDYRPERDFRPLERMPAQHPTCFVPRAVYDQVGLFNPGFRLAMDYEFLLRCHLAGIGFRYLPIVIANFSRTGASSQQAARARREMVAAQILHTDRIALPVYLYVRDRWRGRMRTARRRLLGRVRV